MDITALFLHYKVYIGIAIVVLLVFLYMRSGMLQGQLKKVVKILLIGIVLGIGYYFLTGKSPLTIPEDINSFFSDPHIKDEPSHKYYRDPEETFGDQLK
jgi:hypothetical protein